MKALSAFRPRVAGLVAGIPDPKIDEAVLDACIEFCQESLVVKGTLDPFSTSAGEHEYPLIAFSQQSVAKIMRVWCGQGELQPVDEDAVGGPFLHAASVDGQTARGRPSAFAETAPGVLALYHTPDTAYAITARCALRPTRSATQVEDALFEDWVEAITHGALSRLYLQPGANYDPKLAAVSSGLFKVQINKAHLKSNQGATRAGLRVTPVHI